MRGEVMCFGEVGAEVLSAAHVAGEIATYEAAGFNEILLRINSGGGDVDEAWRISGEVQAVRRRGLQVNAVLEAAADSAASLIALSCDTVLALPTASMLLHRSSPADGWENFDGDDLSAMRKKCGKTDALAALVYSAKAASNGKPRPAAYFATLMNGSTLLDALKLLDLGLVDEVIRGGLRTPSAVGPPQAGAA